MRRVTFFILLFVLTNSLNAQTVLKGLMDNYRFKKMNDGGFVRDNLKMSDIQGSPYLGEEFISGKIVAPEGVTYENMLLRYNAYSDDLEFQKGNDIYNIDPKSIVKKAEFGGMTYSYVNYDSFGKMQSGFFKILAEGNATLLIRYTIKFLEKEKVQPFVDPKPARFDAPKKEYYVSIVGLPAKIIANKKSLLELFGDRKDEMESFISKNKLSIREDDSLIKIITYFNSL